MPKSREVRVRQRMQGNEPTCVPTTISMLGYDTEGLKRKARRRNGLGPRARDKVMRMIGAKIIKSLAEMESDKHTLIRLQFEDAGHLVLLDKHGKWRNPWYRFGRPFGRKILERQIKKERVSHMWQVKAAPYENAPLRKPLWRRFLPS